MALTALDMIWEKGYSAIMSDPVQSEMQKAWVTEAATTIRHMPAEELIKREFLYIPNDIYMLHFFGSEIADYKYGVYRNESCNFYKRLVFPIRGFNNEVVALGGWANDSQWKYVYSPDTLWDKKKYFYIQPEEFKQALTDGYIIIVDGIFDAINLNRLGLHAGSLMGSNLSNWHRTYLKLFKYVATIPDNDNAGVGLVRKLKSFRSDAIVIQQGQFKDIDDYIKTLDTQQLVSMFNNLELLYTMNKVTLQRRKDEVN